MSCRHKYNSPTVAVLPALDQGEAVHQKVRLAMLHSTPTDYAVREALWARVSFQQPFSATLKIVTYIFTILHRLAACGHLQPKQEVSSTSGLSIFLSSDLFPRRVVSARRVMEHRRVDNFVVCGLVS